MKRILHKQKSGRLLDSTGFTLIELMISICVSAIITAAMAITYDHLQSSSIQQVEVGMLQQNLRGILTIMERELRTAGQDFTQSGLFGVTDVRSFTITEPGTDATPDASDTGSPILRMTLDLDNDGAVDTGETVTYALYDRDGDGVLFDLSRSTTYTTSMVNVVSGRELLAEGIETVEFAYAFDNDADGSIDRLDGNVIWAVDSDNDGLLDADLLGAGLGFTVQPANIRAVQIWILARANRPDRKYVNTRQYSVGKSVKGPFNDHYRRWLLTEILHCRNI